jgi:hypothetical protein
MQDRVQRVTLFLRTFVHDGVNIYRKGFRRKRKRGATQLLQYVEQLQTLYAKNQATNGQVTADAERRVTAFIQRRIDKLICLKIHQYSLGIFTA